VQQCFVKVPKNINGGMAINVIFTTVFTAIFTRLASTIRLDGDFLRNWAEFEINSNKTSTSTSLASVCERGNTLIANHLYLQNIAHVSGILFPFYSYVLQKRSAVKNSCELLLILTLSVDQARSIKLVNTGTNGSWIENFISAVNRGFNSTAIRLSIESPSTNSTNITFKPFSSKQHPYFRWFYHPADAYTLGNLILKREPCRNTSSNAVKKDSLSILILDRKNDRTISNPLKTFRYFQGHITKRFATNDTKHATRNNSSSTNDFSVSISSIRVGSSTSIINSDSSSSSSYNAKNNISVIGSSLMPPNDTAAHVPISTVKKLLFEELTLYQQAKAMRDADVVIAIHGAGLTNIAFMSPCSIVIEVFPELYYWPTFYGSLANQTGLLYYFYQATSSQTRRKPNPRKSFQCEEVLKEVRMKIRKALTTPSPGAMRTKQQRRSNMTRSNRSTNVTISANRELLAGHQTLSTSRAMNGSSSAESTVKITAPRGIFGSYTDIPLYSDPAGDHCSQSPHCRYCARTSLSVELDLELMERIIQQGYRDRQRCRRRIPWLYPLDAE
jgi:hypothetical protein